MKKGVKWRYHTWVRTYKRAQKQMAKERKNGKYALEYFPLSVSKRQTDYIRAYNLLQCATDKTVCS